MNFNLKEQLSSAPQDPRKILKIVISISVVLLVMWLFLVSKMDYGNTSEPRYPAVEQQADSMRTLLERESAGRTAAMEDSSPNMFSNAFITFLVLMTLLGFAWLWVRKKSPAETKQQNFQQLLSQGLGQGAELKIVKLNGEIWVLGVTANAVTLLHRYPEEEWNEPFEQPEQNLNSFYQLFRSQS